MDGAVPAALGSAAPLLVIENSPASPEYSQALRHVGRTVPVTLAGQGEYGARLELPSGQVIVASGSLPFPEQTKLQVRASIQDGAIVLRVLEAMPPAPPALLAPLIYGEAAGLLQRLQAKELPEALLPLANLFASLFSSNDARIQKTIESLPVPMQRLISEALGLKDASTAQISCSLVEDLEPVESLSDAQMMTAIKQNIGSQPKIINEQNLNPSVVVLINHLREVFAQYFEQNSEANIFTDTKTIETLIESIKNLFSSKSIDVPSLALQKPPDGESAAVNFEKMLHAIEALPNDSRRCLARALSSDIDSAPKAIAETIISKVNAASKMPEGAAKEVESVKADQTTTKAPLSAADGPAPPNGQPQLVSQKIAQALIGLPVQVRRELSLAFFGFAEAEPKEMAEYLAQKATPANLDKTVIAALEKAPLEIIRVIERALAEAGQKLPSGPEGHPQSMEPHPDAPGPRSSGSNEPAQAARTETDNFAHVPERAPDSTGEGSPAAANKVSKALEGARTLVGKAPNPGVEKSPLASTDSQASQRAQDSTQVATQPVSNKLARTLESLPVAVTRALASATVGRAEAEPKALAEFLVSQGAGLELKHSVSPIIESAPPLIRQLLALLINLPLDSPPRQIAEALGSGGEDVFFAAKSLTMSAEPVLSKPLAGQDRENAAAKKDGRDAHLFVSRLKYLLRFEALIEAQNMSRPLPMEDRNAVSNWFRSIVDLLIVKKTEKNELVFDKQPSTFQSGAAQKPAAHERAIESPPAHGAAADPEKPPTWQSWLKGAIKALIDPQASPKEALFHALATKENVNYFELPLPWAQDRNLEIWVEDGGEESHGHGEKNKKKFRVLLALHFSAIGETRVGLESSPKLLNIAIWAERPQHIEAQLSQMRNELSALGFDANVSINSLARGPDGTVPTIKSQIAGPSLHMLG